MSGWPPIYEDYVKKLSRKYFAKTTKAEPRQLPKEHKMLKLNEDETAPMAVPCPWEHLLEAAKPQKELATGEDGKAQVEKPGGLREGDAGGGGSRRQADGGKTGAALTPPSIQPATSSKPC